ncbi:uncharacterized protein EI90DRAFT_3120347 [Cantharellus anzutake]|uniref:uncharacterized protein n=1 Tax=Cantharellus anzutake TaxID=1750568 RepID=UPI0019030BA3|nr:uncharacterized protein EI90DRAFT_3120347 [Cantharellus anzutake]KAF8335324.1 hypothetical protein EI90DRAFT_3120347 [Cantharellus anzutake]
MAPPMANVVLTVKELLKHDLYHADDSEEDFDSESDSDDSHYSSNSDSDSDSNGSSDSEEESTPSHRKSSKSSKKKPHKESRCRSSEAQDEVKTTTVTKSESKAETKDSVLLATVEDLTDRLKGHSFRDCPETKAFITAGVLRFDTVTKRLVMADGTNLPHSTSGNAIAQLIHKQASMWPTAANLEWMHEYELANQEFATLDEGEFEVYPAYAYPAEHRESEKPRASKAKPYDWPPSPMRCTIPPEELNPPNRMYVEIPAPPKILKWPQQVVEDVPMSDGETAPKDKGKQKARTSTPQVPHTGEKSVKANAP